MQTIFACVFGLLLTPDKHDPIDSTLALSANNDSGEYEASIMTHVRKHATKSRALLVASLADELDESRACDHRRRDPAFKDGARVQLHSLASAEGVKLNGLAGTITGFRTDSGRYGVKLDAFSTNAAGGGSSSGGGGSSTSSGGGSSSGELSPLKSKALKLENLRLLPSFKFDGMSASEVGEAIGSPPPRGGCFVFGSGQKQKNKK
eukprot:SAG31_NODE_208_length_20313_cov_6.143119_13_plen_206_part_00